MKKVLLRTMLTLCSILILCFIFGNSLKNATQSTEQSNAVQEIIQDVFDVITDETVVVSGHAVRKIAHFAEFAALGLFLTLTCFSYVGKKARFLVVPFVTGIVAAVADELIQKFVNGRYSSFTDILIDSAGVTVGLLFAYALCSAFGYLTSRRAEARKN